MKSHNRMRAFICGLIALVVAMSHGFPFTACAGELKSFDFDGKVFRAEEVSTELKPLLRAMRFNEALEEWNLDVVLTNTGTRRFPFPVFLVIEAGGNTIGLLNETGSLAESPPLPFVAVSSFLPGSAYVLEPGKSSNPVTLRLGFLDEGARPTVAVRVFGNPEGEAPLALALTRVLNEVGQPLPEVRVQESGPSGARVLLTDREAGVVTLGQESGDYVWRFEREGFLPAWRRGSLVSGRVELVANPRLLSRTEPATPVNPLGGILTAKGVVQLQIPAGAVVQPGEASLRLFDGQSLPFPLPAGWSPLRGFWFVSSVGIRQSVPARIVPEDAILATETVAVCRLNEVSPAWEVVQLGASGVDGTVEVQLPGVGAYLLAVADSGTLTPPGARVGRALEPSARPSPSSELLTAVGVVSPEISTASSNPDLVTAQANLTLRSATLELSSGQVLRGEVRETYRLQDGSERFTPPYEQYLVGYQRPGDRSNTTVQARFPMRPLLLLGSQELSEAVVTVDLLSAGLFDGQVLRPGGGLARFGDLVLSAAPGDFARPQAMMVTPFAPSRLESLLVPGHVGMVGFHLLVAELEPGRRLGLQASRLPAGRLFMIARVLTQLGISGLEPVERVETTTDGTLRSLEPTVGDRLPGIRQAGQYLLVQVETPSALVVGRVNDAAGRPAAGFPVRLPGLPWMTLTQPDGSYRLVAPTGSVQVLVENLVTRESDLVVVTVAASEATSAPPLSLLDRGPRLISTVPPADDDRVSAVTPVILTFSEPLNLATVTSGSIQVLRTNGQPVSCSVAFNIRSTVVSLLAAEPLPAGERFRVVVADSITDRQGKRIEGPREFAFSTRSDVARGDLAKLTVFEPGATNLTVGEIKVRELIPAFELEPDPLALVVAYGSPGTADGRVPVILVNETSGETSTVLSKADGSFAGFVRAGVEDFVSAVFVNVNGTRTTVAATRQVFDDGRVGLYQPGGILEAESDGGVIQVKVEPNAVSTRSTFKIANLGTAELLQAVNNTQPAGAKLLGGLRVELGGDAVVDGAGSTISIPFDPATLNLPAGESPQESTFALAIPRVINGEVAYQVVDKLRFKDGKLESNTLPFLGFLAVALAEEGISQAAGFALTYLFVGNQQIVVTGKTRQLFELSNPLNPTLAPTRLPKPLSGALVTARPAQIANLGPPGRIGAGTLFSTSGSDGVYSLVVARRTFDLQGQFKEYVVTASHPAFEDTPSNTLDTTFGVAAMEYDFTFEQRINAGSLAKRPRITTSITPRYPALGTTTELKVIAEHLQVPPTIFVSVQPNSVASLVPGVPVTASDITITPIDEVVIGRKRIRRFGLSSLKALEVTLRIGAVAAVGNSAYSGEAFEFVRFGVPVPQVPEQLIPADPADTTGPVVIGTYPQEDGLLAPGERIAITVNEPIRRTVTNDVTAVGLSTSDSGLPALQLSADQRTLFVTPGLLTPGPTHTLLLTTAIRDIAGNSLHRTAAEPSGLSHSIRFRVAPIVKRTLPDLQQGGGAIVHAGHVFALERNGENGTGELVVYRLEHVIATTTALSPAVARRSLAAGFPRDLTLIPNYSFRRKRGGPIETKNLLAVVGGTVGFGGENETGPIPLGQLLRVFDITDPANPSILVGARLTLRPSAVNVVRWSPPHLTYLESGVDLQQVGIIDLQEMIVGFLATAAEAETFPLFGVRGKDENGDGDYVDADDQFPLPEKTPAEFFGKELGLTFEGTTQSIQDYDYLAPFELGVVVVNRGKARNAAGQPFGPERPPSLRVLQAGGGLLSAPSGVLNFDSQLRPQRVFLLPQEQVIFNGSPQTFTLALVSLSLEGGGAPSLAVCDVSFPNNPSLLGSIALPEAVGIPKSITRRPDGLLALSTAEHLVLLDPLRLLLPTAPAPMLHPAVVSILKGAGSGNRTRVTTDYGLSAVSLGSRNEVLIAAPKLSFVHFPTATGIVQPAQLVDNPEASRTEFDRLRRPETLQLSRVKTVAGVASSLVPALPVSHYHVLIEAPGEAGPAVTVALEGLNESGHPLQNKGPLFPPVRALSDTTLAGIGQTPRAGYDAPIGRVRAFRLSSDPASRFYNTFLSTPFVLTSEKIASGDLIGLRENPAREVLWSGAMLRATIDPQEAGNTVLGDFASTVDTQAKQLRPGVAALALTLSGHYLFGPNPPPVGGELSMPHTFGLVNAANGELRHGTVDISLPSRRMPIQFVRAYGGQDLFEGPFGRGWDFNYNQRLIEYRPDTFPEGSKKPLVIRNVESANSTVQAGDLVFQSGEARVMLFALVRGGPPAELTQDPLLTELGWFSGDNAGAKYYVPGPNEAGVFDVICRFPAGEFCRVTPSGLQSWYAQSGRLERVLDRYPKNRHLLRYNERGELVRIVDESVATDRYLRLGYFRLSSDPLFDSSIDRPTTVPGSVGKIARLKDFTETEEREILFDYDVAGKGLLERRQGFRVEGNNGGFSGRPTTRYLWDTQGTHLVGVVEGNGANGSGEANNATPLFAATTSVNGEQAPVVTGGSGAGGSVQISVPVSSTQNSAAQVSALANKNTAPDEAKTEFQFDERGYPRSLALSKAGDAAGPATYQPSYDALGRLESMIYPEGNSVTYTYVANPTTLRSRANVISTTLSPGPRGGETVVSSQSGGYDLRYNQPTGDQITFNNKTLRYTLTSDGREVERVVYGTAGAHGYQYNEFGQVEFETTPEGVTLDPSYRTDDGFVQSMAKGELVTRLEYGGGGGFSKAGALGQPTVIHLPRQEASAVNLEYDARLRTRRTQRGDFEERHEYDEAGNGVYVRRTVDRSQFYEQTRVYNQVNFLTSMTLKGVAVQGQAQSLTTTFVPDAAFRIREIRYPDQRVRSFQYNHFGHRTRMSMGAAADAADDSETYGRDLSGNLTSLSRRDQLVRSLSYDGHNRVIAIVNKAGGDKPDDTVTLSYFGEGQKKLTRVKTGDEVVLETEVLDVDELGRPKVEALRGQQASGNRNYSYQAGGAGGLTITIDGPLDVVRYTVDSAGRTNRMQNGLATVNYRLDANGNLEHRESVESGVAYTSDYVYDALDYRSSETDPEAVGLPRHSFELRLDGRILSQTDGRGKRTSLDYSVLGETLRKQSPAAGGASVEVRRQYDAQRQPTAVTDRDGLGNTSRYDSQMRLVGLKLPSGDELTFSEFSVQNQPQTITLPGGGTINRQGGYDLQGRLVKQSTSFAGQDYKTDSTVYDALGRVRSIKYGSEAQYSASFGYDRLGPLSSAAYSEAGGTFVVRSTPDANGRRISLTYPSGVTLTETRERSGRLQELKLGGQSLWKVTAFRGAELPGDIELAGAIRQTQTFDRRKRLVARRYDRVSDGQALVDLRVVYDAADNVIARQQVERGGRADIFGYDDAHRIIRVESGARPQFSGAVRTAPGLDGGPSLEAGFFARTYTYDTGGKDLLIGGGNLINPDQFPEQGQVLGAGPLAARVPAFAKVTGGFDNFLHASVIDGVNRGTPDALGNVRGTVLWPRPANGSGPVQVAGAVLTHNALNHLVRIELPGGTVISYEHQPNGLMHHKRVEQGGTLLSDRIFVWDEGRMIEEYEQAGGAPLLVGRYYYADSDWPVAAHLRETSSGELKLVYYLCDQSASVVAVADDTGRVRERVTFDPWGQPEIETLDAISPRVAAVQRTASGDLLFQMSESVLPVPVTGGQGLVTAARSLEGWITVTQSGNPVEGEITFVENEPGFPFGTMIRFRSTRLPPGALRVALVGGRVRDGWGNGNLDEVLNVPAGTGTVFTGIVADTSAPRAARSALGNPFLFQGQYLDYDSGLVFMRARNYDPFTGAFLERDPDGYENSVNLYAAFGHNPASRRDPTGRSWVPLGQALRREMIHSGQLARPSVFGEVTEMLMDTRQLFRRGALSPDEIAQAGVEGGRIQRSLEKVLAREQAAGRYGGRRWVDNLGPLQHHDGSLRGIIGLRGDVPGTSQSTIELNRALLDPTSGAPADLRDAYRFNVFYHEADHLWSVFVLDRPTGRGGIPYFLEEYRAFRSGTLAEIHVMGVNASAKSGIRQAFEQRGPIAFAEAALTPGYLRRITGELPEAAGTAIRTAEEFEQFLIQARRPGL